MKKVSKLPVVILLALVALLAVCVFGLSHDSAASADEEYTDTYISAYSISYDIKSNRSMSVTEDITVSFDNRRAVIRYIPVNAGEMVRNLKVHEIIGGEPTSVNYDVSLDSSFVSVDIGGNSVKFDEHVYRISYEYCLTRAQEGKNMLALTPVGADWPCRISNISIEMKLPAGYIGGSSVCFVNNANNIVPVTENTVDGRTVLTARISGVRSGSEVRMDLKFESGALSTYSEITPYAYTIAAVVILAALVLLKLFVFNKNYITPVVNYEAPNKLDPLMMGKLIDNNIDKEDITSMIFYWASKGYVKINLDNEDDPTIIKIVQSLPESSPAYERLMYNSMFQLDEIVTPSMLKYSFYRTVEQVKNIVNKQTRGLHDSKSVGVSILLAILGGLLLGLAPFLIAFIQVSAKIIFLAPFAAIIPVIVIYAFSQGIKYNRFKYKKQKLILMCAGVALFCIIFGIFYVFLIPNCLMGYGPKITLYIASCLIFTTAVAITSRTKEYTEKLNDILGFKNFIALAEKDELEMMLEEDPQFYYHILPYAQVLGVSDKWEEKFKDITIQPPAWLTGNLVTTYVEFRVINSMMRRSFGRMSTEMAARPSSSGLSGGSHGHFGGFSGGGHGGGGGRFR